MNNAFAFFISKGGMLMYPLVIIGFLIFSLGIYQILTVLLCSLPLDRQKSKNPWVTKALVFSQSKTGFKGISFLASLEICMTKLEESLNRKISTLRFLGQISTLTGFLGTVTGMVRTFQAVATKGAATPSLLAGGIYEALFTTILGLILSIIAAGLVHTIETLSRNKTRTFENKILLSLTEEAK